jgi:hypothetical protein
MFNDEYVDKLFKFVIVELPVNEFIIFNNDVDVACTFDIFNDEYVDKVFKFEYEAYIDKSGLFIIVEFQSG